MISERDKGIVRELARRVRDIAADPVQEDRKRLWHKINRLERCRIPVKYHVEEFCWLEVLPDSVLKTTDDTARYWEKHLRRLIWKWENLNDDWVTEPVIGYGLVVRYPARLSPAYHRPDARTGAYYTTPVIEIESDIDNVIVDNECSVDWDATERNLALAEEIFGGILEPVPAPVWLGCCIFDYVCEIRGMGNVFADMVDRPEWLEDLIGRVHGQHIGALKKLEELGALCLNNGRDECYNGGLSYTDELPADGFDPEHVRLKDLWGFSTAQAAVSISPEMHERFVTQFDRECLKLFGLNAAACCETIDDKMHLYRTIPNLRRVSVSEFNDFAKAAEEIGTDYIYSVKPTGTHVALPEWNTELERTYLSDILDKSRGCHVEIVNNTISTCHGEPQRVRDWCNIAMELAEKYSG